MQKAFSEFAMSFFIQKVIFEQYWAEIDSLSSNKNLLVWDDSI